MVIFPVAMLCVIIVKAENSIYLGIKIIEYALVNRGFSADDYFLRGLED